LNSPARGAEPLRIIVLAQRGCNVSAGAVGCEPEAPSGPMPIAF
jgi:hypothetical protein